MLSLLPTIRAQFPALSGPDTLLDNAGGSQLPLQVIDAMTRYMRETFVQLNADYETSKTATELEAPPESAPLRRPPPRWNGRTGSC